jgi:hypothetical protein
MVCDSLLETHSIIYIMSKYVWNDNGLCSVAHLRTKRFCRVCGFNSRFLVNVARKQYEHLTCGLASAKL